MSDAEHEMREVVRAFEKYGLGELVTSAHGTSSPHIAVLRVLKLLMERDLDVLLKRQPPRVTNASLATDLVGQLNFRRESRPPGRTTVARRASCARTTGARPCAVWTRARGPRWR